MPWPSWSVDSETSTSPRKRSRTRSPSAVQRWTSDGLPPSPAGWIITTARNRIIDRLRREASRDDRHAQAALMHGRDDLSRRSGAEAEPDEEDVVRDERLRLIFTCCHPALALNAQVALTLRLLGGLTTEDDRARVSGSGSNDGAAAGQGEGQDSRRADSVSRAAGGRPPRSSARGSRGRLSRVQRGLHRELGRAAGARMISARKRYALAGSCTS